MAGSLKENEILEKLETFVIHENKIVTYKWLSKTFSLDCNIAKQYLQKFIDTQKFKVDQINICYFVAGFQVLNDNSKIYKFLITSDKNLEKSKQKFSLLTNVHLYSIQFSRLQDASSSLYTTEIVCNDKNFENVQKYSAIQNKEVEIIFKKETPQEMISNDYNELKSEIKSQNSSNKGKSKGLFSLWQKKNANVEKLKPNKLAPNDFKSSKLSSNNENKQNSIQLDSLPNEKKIEKEVNIEKVSKKTNLKRKNRSSSKFKNKKNEMSSKESDEGPKNKHKRIMLLSESESDSEEETSDDESSKKRFRFDDDDDCENMEENPIINKENNEEPLPSNISNNKISYKTVCKTYLDEDGFMVTKKVKECVEEIIQEKEIVQEEKPQPPEKKTNPINKKQASLMNFFSKK